ncbi:LOW QUALITY PROTEIN: hypothetical protein SETIT_2G024100v2 [Setaria italica]|uniref:F-box protein AT5G49610-like beta-propeller domain-containing protein n=1 Tax=Setaria italica TaxID=4555 RepID=A0A368PUQ8_SETIT|nr:LOW QUALITY PROTEIN: hypothetical protein SETIT_2G024100v2 [Setaria italica]
MAPPPPELMPELVGEILLRLPPDEPEHLLLAALVCKPWFRTLCNPAFRRRYHAFHRTPPLLGFLHRLQVIQGDPPQLLAPTTAAPLPPYPNCHRTRLLDCRHGRVLIHVGDDYWHFIVWGPVTGDDACRSLASFPWLIYSAAVLCSVPGCDHLDCHGGLFRVVFIATDDDDELVKVSAYSSETGEWSVPVSLGDDCEAYVKHQQSATERSYYTPYVQPRWGAVIGDEIYFTLRRGNAIVKYDWSYNCLSMISPQSLVVYSSRISLMVTEDSSLGFACIGGSNLFLWSRKVNSQGAPEWVQCRVIDLEKIIPVADSSDERLVVGSAEGVGVIFISTGVGLFMIELKSGRVRKVDVPGVYFSILPYMSFYTPDHCRLSSVAKD